MSTITASAILLGIERAIRQARDMTALQFVAVTETRRLIAYQQAVLLAAGMDGKLRVVAVSNVPTVDRNAPYVRFVEKLANQGEGNGRGEPGADTRREGRRHGDPAGPAGPVSGAPMGNAAADHTGGSPMAIRHHVRPHDGGAFDRDWQEFLQDHVLDMPIASPDGVLLGRLLLIRAAVWLDGEKMLLEQLGDALGHAWNAIKPRRKRHSLLGGGRRRMGIMAGIVVALAIVLCIPVRQSIIAPATVTPRDPARIAAPISGVIREILVQPNAPVSAGQVLFTFEDAELRANYDIALRAVDSADAELRRAAQQAFGDARGRAEVALQQTRLALRQEQAAFSQYQLSQVAVRAPQAGIAIFSDPNDWRGQPVSTGEQVMVIARPDAADLGIQIPVSDAIALEPGAEVRLFLDIDPLVAIAARLEYSAYQPQETPEGILAYRAVAHFDDPATVPRIGLRGSARVMGDDVPLALFLFRRPLAALRQKIGF